MLAMPLLMPGTAAATTAAMQHTGYCQAERLLVVGGMTCETVHTNDPAPATSLLYKPQVPERTYPVAECATGCQQCASTPPRASQFGPHQRRTQDDEALLLSEHAGLALDARAHSGQARAAVHLCRQHLPRQRLDLRASAQPHGMCQTCARHASPACRRAGHPCGDDLFTSLRSESMQGNFT